MLLEGDLELPDFEDRLWSSLAGNWSWLALDGDLPSLDEEDLLSGLDGDFPPGGFEGELPIFDGDLEVIVELVSGSWGV